MSVSLPDPRTCAFALRLRFEGSPRALSKLKAKGVGKALQRPLNLSAVRVDEALHTSHAVDVVVVAAGVSLLELREAWAAGLLSTHQDVRAVQLEVFTDLASDGVASVELDARARKVVTLRRD